MYGRMPENLSSEVLLFVICNLQIIQVYQLVSSSHVFLTFLLWLRQLIQDDLLCFYPVIQCIRFGVPPPMHKMVIIATRTDAIVLFKVIPPEK